MNSYIVLVAIVAVFTQTFNAAWAVPCTSDEECPFGKCDLDEEVCRCNLDCSDFGTDFNQYGCSNRDDMPVYLCTEVNEACIAGVNFVIRQPTYEVLHNHNYSCNSVFEEESEHEKEFCEDQSYCNNNGICFMDISNETPYCMCDESHSGARCESFTSPATERPKRSISSLLQALISRKQRSS